ncbi:hypothetical protein Zmor_000784 [Zophobas morio]|uniref:Protein TsetseEP domain-containing protein n=1 Tax=Zophobas morio TaxID=2755281 RepID=A0AA38IWZ2_9CUCU|nr:hypothetical protein Zmor_000784 [Zophobas morio]
MFKLSFLLVFVVLASQVHSSVVKTPRDLVDQIEEELNQLSSIVQGAILVAHNDLSNLEYDFLNYGNNVMLEAGISIDQEKQSIDTQLTTITDMANSVNADISPCTDIRQELLERLPAEYTNQLKTCIFDKNKQEAGLVSDAKYVVDVVINKVHNLEFQVRQCKESILCLQPILTEIELDKIRLPQTINTEVLSVDTFLTSLKLSVVQCSDSSVSQYIADATTILQQIIDCVNRIIG